MEIDTSAIRSLKGGDNVSVGSSDGDIGRAATSRGNSSTNEEDSLESDVSAGSNPKGGDESLSMGEDGTGDMKSAGHSTNASTASRMRQVAIVMFIYMAVFLPLVIYIFARNREVEIYESDYEALSATVTANFAKKLAIVVNAMDSLAIAATSHAMNNNDTWPFVTMFDYDRRGASVLGYADILATQFRPIVTNETRDQWEQYSQDNIGWFYEAEKRQNRVLTLHNHEEDPVPGLDVNEKNIVQEIYTLDAALKPTPVEEEERGPLYFPSWQTMPLVTDLINMHSIPFGDDYISKMAATESKEAVIGNTRAIPIADGNLINRYYDFLLQAHYDDDTVRHNGEPVSTIFYPTFDSFEKDRKVVGVMNAPIFWMLLFQDILPQNSNGIVCVLENSGCGGVAENITTAFTFNIDGNGATYAGAGDLHEKEYDDFAVVYHLENATMNHGNDSKNQGKGFRFSGTAVPLNSDFCPYTLTVYPSDELYDAHYTSEPPLYAVGVMVLFLVVFIASLAYDCVVRNRMRHMIKAANENKALVASIFPEGVRDRLFEDGGEEAAAPVFAMGATNKTRLRAMLGVKESNKAGGENIDDSFLTAKPIADLFPHCTVLFADISGFSAWSSERQPEQVFTLLESIFQTYDRIAKRRNVFKVETIGDSYVAVTGLPDAQPDHAVRMARFARECISKVNTLTKMLEATLGPDTGDLKMRFGLHSGQVTAGVLRGEKTRFQLFGDTVNTAARMESTGIKNRIQLSQTTAQRLIESGKENWIVPREDTVKAKGKGVVQTYWMIIRESNDEGSIGRNSFISSGGSTGMTSDSEELAAVEDLFAADTNEGVWGDQAMFIAPTSIRTAKSRRLVDWLTEIIGHDLKRVAAHRNTINKGKDQTIDDPDSLIYKAGMPLEEVVEAFAMPSFNAKTILRPEEIEAFELPQRVRAELHDFVSRMSSWYRVNPFHNFEHASHVTMSAVKLLQRIITPEGVDYAHDDAETIAAEMHMHTFGITSDPLAQFATTIAALVHDVDHMGVPNGQVAKEVPGLGEKYKQQSIAEQNSIDIAWRVLMEPKYRTLQGFIFRNERELRRFRQYLVNMVCATDIFNKDMKALRNQRWEKAFFGNPGQIGENRSLASGSSEEDFEDETSAVKATIILEHIIQAADVSHTMQHWNVYKKWNERLFQEMSLAYDDGRSDKDPVEGWYNGELWFFDNYIIPLAQKLEECGVFGVSSDECLNYALENRKEWALKGKDVVKEMTERYRKKKMMDMDGFTADDVENFSTDDLDSILHRLIKKGRTLATFKSEEDGGLHNAAKAFYNAFELYEKARVMGKLRDNSLVFAIFSGILVFLKGGLILQDPEGKFEEEMANNFFEEAKAVNSNVHKSRALSMKCEVAARQGRFDEALETFEELNKTYIIEEHSQNIVKYYGTDRAAQMYSQRALWHHVLGDNDNEVKCCEYAVDKILPWMETKNVLNTFELLYPIIRLQKDKAAANMLYLFEKDIMAEFNGRLKKVTLCRPVLAPLKMLLRVLVNPGSSLRSIEDILSFLAAEGSHEIEAFFDRYYSRLGWAPNSIIAELCLLVANRMLQQNGPDDLQAKSLVQKGLYLARLVQLRHAGLNGIECAIEINEKVLGDLMLMATERLDCLSDVREPHEEDVVARFPLKTKLGEIKLAV